MCVFGTQNPKLVDAIQALKLGGTSFVGAFLVKDSVEGASGEEAASASGRVAGSAEEGELGGGTGNVVAGSIWKGPEGAMHEWDPSGPTAATGTGVGADSAPVSGSDPRDQRQQLAGKQLYDSLHHYGTFAQVTPAQAPANSQPADAPGPAFLLSSLPRQGQGCWNGRGQGCWNDSCLSRKLCSFQCPFAGSRGSKRLVAPVLLCLPAADPPSVSHWGWEGCASAAAGPSADQGHRSGEALAPAAPGMLLLGARLGSLSGNS